MWHKAIWKGHPMRLELTRVGLLGELANHYTTRGAFPELEWLRIATSSGIYGEWLSPLVGDSSTTISADIVTSISMYVHVCIYIYTFIHLYIYTFMCTHSPTNINIYVHLIHVYITCKLVTWIKCRLLLLWNCIKSNRWATEISSKNQQMSKNLESQKGRRDFSQVLVTQLYTLSDEIGSLFDIKTEIKRFGRLQIFSLILITQEVTMTT